MSQFPSKEFLDSLVVGQTVRVTRHTGDVTGRIAAIKPRLFIVRIGRETRRFVRADGGAFNAPDPTSKSYLMPIKEADRG